MLSGDMYLVYLQLHNQIQLYCSLVCQSTFCVVWCCNVVPTTVSFSLGELVDKLDPIITSWTNNSVIWQDIKRAIYYTTQTLSWVRDRLESLPGMKKSCGKWSDMADSPNRGPKDMSSQMILQPHTSVYHQLFLI